MRTPRPPQKPVNSDAAGCTFTELDKAVCEDIHTELSRLNSGGNEYDLWNNLERVFRDYCKALEHLDSNIPFDEIRHAFGAYRCLAACLTENNLLQDYGGDRGDSFLNSLIAEDRDFRLVYALWRWSHNCAAEFKGFADLAHQCKDIRDFSGNGVSDLKRLIRERKVTPDPDSILKVADDPSIDRIMRVLFSLLRCGRFEEAIELLRTTCLPWMVTYVRTQQLLTDSNLLSAELASHERARLHYREQSYQTMTDGVAETSYTMPVRMVYAALLGDWKFLLPLATNVDDRIWCYANAAVHARLNAALGIKHPIFAPTTVEGIFEAINAAEPTPYYVLMSFMLRGAWDEAVDWMYEYCKKLDADKKGGTEASSLHRFFGLVTSACRILKHGHNDSHGKAVVGKMIDVLLQKGLYSLIPFFASLLPKGEALKQIWNVMPYVKTDNDRVAFIASLNEAGFDGEDLAVEFGRFRVVENVDHADYLRWIFACGDRKLLPAVGETNSVLRYFLLGEMETEAKALINECEHLKLVDRLSAMAKSERREEMELCADAAEVVIDEFNNHCLYFFAQAQCSNFTQECARALSAAQKKLEDERGSEGWQRQGDLLGLSERNARAERNQTFLQRSLLALDACKARTLDAITAFVRHPGWRPEPNEDWSRLEQLKALRERLYAHILRMLLHNLDLCNDSATIIDVLVVLADEKLKLYEDLTPVDLSQILVDVHKLAGHALS